MHQTLLSFSGESRLAQTVGKVTMIGTYRGIPGVFATTIGDRIHGCIRYRTTKGIPGVDSLFVEVYKVLPHTARQFERPTKLLK